MWKGLAVLVGRLIGWLSALVRVRTGGRGRSRRPERPLAPDEWPGVVAQWRPGHVPAAIEVRLRRPAQTGRPGRPGRAGPGAATAWESVAVRVADPRLMVSLASPFLSAPAPLEATALAGLREFVAGCRESQAAHTFSIELPAPAATSAGIGLPLDLRLELVRPAAPGDAADTTSLRLAPAVPLPRPDEEMSGALCAVATAFHAAYPDFRLALRDAGDAAPSPAGDTPRAWAVAESALTFTRRAGAARFFAPRPVSTELLSVAGARLTVFPPDTEPAPVDLTGFDADPALAGFLGDLERVLHSPTVGGRRPRRRTGLAASPQPDRRTRRVEELLDSASGLLEGVGQRVGPVFADADTDGLTEATEAYVEAVRADLRQAYAVAGIVQLDLDAAAPRELFLRGDVVRRGPGEAGIRLAAGRLHLRPGEPGRLCVLVGGDGSDPARVHGGYAELAPRLRLTHVAGAEADVRRDDQGEEHVAWLRLVPLEPESLIDLGDEPLRVPLPVRRFPVPARLVAQTAVAAVDRPITLEEGCGWRYRFGYQPGADYDPGVDSVRLAVTYGLRATPPSAALPRRADTRGPLVAALASWQASAPAVLAQLATPPSAAPAQPGDPLCAAVQYVARTATAIASALRDGHGAPGLASPSQSPAAAEPTDRFQVEERGGILAVVSEPGTVRAYVAHREAADGTVMVGPAETLDVRRVMAAVAALQLERNAELVPGRVTASDFVYRGPLVRFPDAVRPVLAWPEPIAGPAVSLGPAAGSGASSRTAGLAQALRDVLRELIDPDLAELTATVTAMYEFSGGGPTSATLPEVVARLPLARMDMPCTAQGLPDLAALADGLATAIARELPQGITAGGAGIVLETTLRALASGPGLDSLPVLEASVWLPVADAVPAGPNLTL